MKASIIRDRLRVIKLRFRLLKELIAYGASSLEAPKKELRFLDTFQVLSLMIMFAGLVVAVIEVSTRD